MYAFIGFAVMPWVAKLIYDVYGTLEVDTGLRQYRDVYASTAKKNGKSFAFGGMPIYHLDQEDEPDARAVGIATTRKQASEVFDSACQLIHANPRLQSVFEITKSSRTIAHRRKGGRYEVLSADGERNDGVRVSLGLVDELHRFRSPKEEGIHDAVKRGVRGRRQPLFMKISTAGDPTDSRLWLREYQFAKQVLAGTVTAPRYYAMIHEADPERLKADPEYWKSKEARLAANPSHEDFGGFIRDEELVADLNQAIQIPEEQVKYFRYTLNAMSESESKLFKAAEWSACGDTLRTLIDRQCYAGIDLSATSDLTALVLAFPDATDNSIDVLPFFWVPKDRVPGIAKMLGPWGPKFTKWVKDGLIETTDGNVIDKNAILDKLKWAKGLFPVKEIWGDPWNLQPLAADLTEAGFDVMVVEQTFNKLSPATKWLKELILNKKIRHGNHEVLAWNAACTSTRQDLEGNIKPKKIKRNEEAVRIDGIAALVNVLHRLVTLREERSVYETSAVI